MRIKNTVILGSGSYGEVFLNYLKEQGHNVIGFFDDNLNNSKKIIFGVPVIGTFNDLLTEKSKKNIDYIYCPIGDNEIRYKYLEKLMDYGYDIPNFIHKSVIFESESIKGKGIYLLPGVIIMPHTIIKSFVIISMGSKIAHHTIIEDGVFVSTGVNVGANITIKRKSFLGISSTIMTGVNSVGENAVIGCGAVVIRNVEKNHIVAGVPAKTLKIKKNVATKKKAKEYNLFVKELKTLEEINIYKELLTNYWCDNVYYSYEYLKYYENSTDELRYFLLTEDGIPATIMPFYIRKIDGIENYKDVITPYGYGGPLCKDCSKTKILNHFWSMVDGWYYKNNIVSEFVRFNLNGNHVNYTGELSATLRNVKGTVKENDEDQWNAFSTKVRNNYRKAESHELTFKIWEGKDITDSVITAFHDVYIETMERNHASAIYFFPKQYFESIIYTNRDNFAIAISYKDGIAVSVELIIINNSTLYAFLGGTRAAYFECRPNDFLRVEILKWAVQQEKKSYILGGGLKDDDGLYKSKKVFFPKDDDVIFYTGRKIINKEIYDSLSEPTVSATACDEVCNYFPTYRRPY
ncbi:NeuD/PglB/VioB family sugar acetyltransferase [Cellulophaga sp. 20_2_10]|uniref:NeuD/PglB/VioB family sugar acetyltransferase n=1 Tax=Cellulophaga sp. 20_2_10 TaxID=2942476 RepID=UPI00201B3272|nr:NeuD/PglB/VioB family sugar acetyltransferase [Cellulophaga sp. 20_2_10]MCL5244795.1 NeuD/PglB/VioB family sugar acetyltransferase [Cellulophaga sp. 20_2_10]